MIGAHNKLKEPANRVKLLKTGFTGTEIETIYCITGSLEKTEVVWGCR